MERFLFKSQSFFHFPVIHFFIPHPPNSFVITDALQLDRYKSAHNERKLSRK